MLKSAYASIDRSHCFGPHTMFLYILLCLCSFFSGVRVHINEEIGFYIFFLCIHKKNEPSLKKKIICIGFFWANNERL